MTVYLDTSSLLKLYVDEAGSDDIHELVLEAQVVATSIVAYPEARAALARLRRSGHLSASTFAAAKREFEEQWPAYFAVELTVGVSHEAGELAERYALRGFDAVHLASFADVARRVTPSDARFSSFDQELNKAARHLARRLDDRR